MVPAGRSEGEAVESTSQRLSAGECAGTEEARTRKFLREELACLLLAQMGKPKAEGAVTRPRPHGLSAAELRISPNSPYPLLLHSPNQHPCLGTGSEEGPANSRGGPTTPGALCRGPGGFPAVLGSVWSPWPRSLQPSAETGSLRTVKGGRSNSPSSDALPLSLEPLCCLWSALLRQDSCLQPPGGPHCFLLTPSPPALPDRAAPTHPFQPR